MNHRLLKPILFAPLFLIPLFFAFNFQAAAAEKELNTDALYNAEFIDYIYRGHFENVDLKHTDIFFLAFFEQYMRAYGQQCSHYLPEDKVKIMEQVCTAERVTKNGYGTEISRNCVEWEWQWSGLYARADLYEARNKLADMHNRNALGTFMNLMAGGGSIENSMDLYHRTQGLQMDLKRIFKLNKGDGKALRRFENNLMHFALGESGIRMDTKSKYEKMKISGGPTGSQNFAELIDDLVADQSKTWMMNRYVRRSVYSVSISSQDSHGRPSVINANYHYSSFAGTSSGSVKVVFKNGLPNCIYFWDFPSTCKTPSSSIVASYGQGEYAK